MGCDKIGVNTKWGGGGGSSKLPLSDHGVHLNPSNPPSIYSLVLASNHACLFCVTFRVFLMYAFMRAFMACWCSSSL